MPFVIDALHGFSVNAGGISAPGFPARVHGRVLYSEDSGLERIVIFFLAFHLWHLDLFFLLLMRTLLAHKASVPRDSM